MWSAPAQPEFVPRLNPHSWLGDAAHRDQFVLRYNNETEIHWAERAQQPTIEYGGEREKEGGLYWCEQYTQWSPAGSLLATFHNKGPHRQCDLDTFPSRGYSEESGWNHCVWARKSCHLVMLTNSRGLVAFSHDTQVRPNRRDIFEKHSRDFVQKLRRRRNALCWGAGIALWGDASFSKQGRFAHLGVKSLIFSPNENYMITANDQSHNREAARVRYISLVGVGLLECFLQGEESERSRLVFFW